MFSKYITNAIDCSNNGVTKLNSKAISMRGMSSFKVRNFLNKLLEMPNSRYLEIGVFAGSTLYSALLKNSPEFVVAIDNFSSNLSNNQEAFLKNLSDVGVEFEFINSDCFLVKEKLNSKKFNIYFYDGDHSEQSQYQALKYFYDNLDNEFIYICDDWNWQDVKDGTYRAIKEQNISIIEEWQLPSNFNCDKENWWNGVWVSILRKTK
jgi:hypothetical protein